MRYLKVEILKGSYTSNLNYSENANNFVIECNEGNYQRHELEGCLIIRLVKGNLPNTIKAVIIDPETNEPLMIKNHLSPMFGGYYVTTSDSRFTKLCSKIVGLNAHFSYPVPLHDRFELAQY